MDVHQLIQGLSHEDKDVRAQTASDIVNYLKVQEAFPSPQFKALLELIFSCKNHLSAGEKKFMIRHLLVPQQLLENNIIYRVISAIGYTRIYYKDGMKVSLVRLPLSVQTALLEWLICCLHIFETSLFTTLTKLLPVLFSLLSYEYLRPLVANLVFLTLVNAKQGTVLVKKWHIQTVVDLALKFPMDQPLNLLLFLFQELVVGLDYLEYTEHHDTLNNLKEANFLKYPSSGFLEKLNKVHRQVYIQQSIKHQYRAFRRNLGRARDHTSIVSMGNMSLKDLALNIGDIGYINFRGLFVSPPGYFSRWVMTYYVCFKFLLDQQDDYFSQMNQFLETALSSQDDPDYTVLRENVVDVMKQFPDLCSITAIQNIHINPQDPVMVLKSLRFCYSYLSADHIKTSLTYLITRDEYVSALLNEVYLLLLTWTDTPNSSKMKEVLTVIFQTLEPRQLTLSSKYSLLRILKVIQNDNVLQHLNDSSVLLPVPVFYSILLTINPYIFSEMCRYLAHTKHFNFSEPYKKIHNSMVIDTVNFVWRDKAFYHDQNSFSRGMYLDTEVIDKLPTINTFNYSNLVQLNIVGNLFHNPIWSTIALNIVRELEDKFDANVRHPGPLTEESVSQILLDPDTRWLSHYEDTKLQVLDEIHSKFPGIRLLLESTLKSIAQRYS